MAIELAVLMLIAAVALFVAAPLTEGFAARQRTATADAAAGLEHDRGLAMAGIRDLDFDHATGKVDEADFHALRNNLETRALGAMAGLDRLREADPSSQPMPGSAAPATGVCCAQCGVKASINAEFCGGCGAALKAATAAKTAAG